MVDASEQVNFPNLNHGQDGRFQPTIFLAFKENKFKFALFITEVRIPLELLLIDQCLATLIHMDSNSSWGNCGG